MAEFLVIFVLYFNALKATVIIRRLLKYYCRMSFGNGERCAGYLCVTFCVC